MQRLKGKVAVVTGASRGAGRGIALTLGEEGATVYVTGRSVRGGATVHSYPGTIDDTADEVTARGGVGIPVQCDHTQDDMTAALFERVGAEHGRLDLLVNNAWGGHDPLPGHPVGGDGRAFWERPAPLWDLMFTAGVRAAFMASRFAVPLMLPRSRGLIVNTSFLYDKYGGYLPYDLAKNALNRLALAMAGDLRTYGIAAVAVSPGWMRTEIVLGEFKATEETWQQIPALASTESTFYVGRAVAALAADPMVMTRSGQTLRTGDLAREYGFTDIDGRSPAPFIV